MKKLSIFLSILVSCSSPFCYAENKIDLKGFHGKLRAQLHELGNIISHSDAHKHGAYILEHADVTGFALTELHRLGLLVLGQKGKLKKVMIDHDDKWFFIQMMCLRLAVILCHARKDPAYE